MCSNSSCTKIKIGSLSAVAICVAIDSHYSFQNPQKIIQILKFKFNRRWSMKTILLFVLIIIQSSFAQLQNTFIDSVYPYQNSTYFQSDETIKIFFSEPMNETTITVDNVSICGNLTGKYNADVVYQSGNNSLEIQPTTQLKVGEQISITLDSMIQTAANEYITPFVSQFNVKPESGSLKFAIADSLQLDFSPTQIASADLNNDGHIDLVVSNYDSSKTAVALNDGIGKFSVTQILSGEFKPVICHLADIDSDGDVDMIIPTNEENTIQLYKNNGQGSFSSFNSITVNAPIGICPGDFNGDGHIDFVALVNYANFDGRAYFYKNDGSGDFTESGYIATGFPQAIRNIVGDIDNDGDLDIIGGTSDYWGVYKILVNDGTGNFTYTGGPYIGPYPDELAGADFDGDYDLDFIKSDWYQSGIQIGINDGSGTYNILNLGNVGGSPRNPVVNDFDGDGDLDAVNTNGNLIQILTNNGLLNFVLNNSYPMYSLNGLTSADFDSNGSIDLAAISSTKNQIIFLKNCVDSLVAYWPLDGNLTDTSGNFNNGVNYGGTYDFDRYGNANNSIYFEGSDSYTEGINPGNNLPVGSTPRTFSCWIKSNEASSDRNIFHYGTTEIAPTNYHLFMHEGKYVGIGNGYGYGILISNKDIGDNSWHFITTVYDGSSTNLQHIFIDGKLDTSDVISTTPNTVLTNIWKMGQFMAGSSSLLGQVDDLKIYNTILSNHQIWDMYKASTTAPNLLFPGNDSTLINPYPTIVLDWDSLFLANEYRLLISSDSSFNTIVKDTLTNTSSFDLYYQFFIYFDNLYWKVRNVNDGGIGPWSEVNHFSFIYTDVKEETQLPIKFALMQNYPNPFNPSTKISWQSPVGSWQTLKIYDVLGNEVATLVDEFKPAGKYEVEFNSHSDEGQNLSSGVYFYQLKAGYFLQTMKMILMK